MEITRCTKADYDRIITDLGDFWESSTIESLKRQHNPVFLYEFGDTAFVARDGDRLLGYLFGLFSQTEPVAYVKFVGVRASYRKTGIGRALYEYFIEMAKRRGCRKVKAITTPGNAGSIAFHRKLGIRLLGDPDENGVPVVKDYAGPGQDRVVFIGEIE